MMATRQIKEGGRKGGEASQQAQVRRSWLALSLASVCFFPVERSWFGGEHVMSMMDA